MIVAIARGYIAAGIPKAFEAFAVMRKDYETKQFEAEKQKTNFAVVEPGAVRRTVKNGVRHPFISQNKRVPDTVSTDTVSNRHRFH